MTSTDIKTIELIVNSEQAKKRLDELNQRLTTMKQKREEALNKGDSKGLQVYSKEIQKIEREIRRTESRANTMTRALHNLDRSAPKELKRTLAELNRELNSGRVQRGSAEWNTLTRAIRETKEAISQVNGEMRTVQRSSWSDRLAEWGNKWMGLVMNIQGATLTINGVRQVLQQTISDFANMEEAMAQVRKYTGMTTDEVKDLNEALKKIDTRTSRERLNELAGDAGKLGITAKDKILEFVDAADKINVALGDDLGADAVKNIGKLAMMFGEDERIGLRGAMLATGSVINELSQNSSAAAGYLASFTARLSGVGKQAKLSQADIMGFGAVLDENMQTSELASTAFSQLITKMFQNPAKFAQLAGIEVAKFSELLKTDANEALLRFFEAMRSRGGFDALVPMFAEMGLNGVRATSVLSAVADKLADVREMQKLANDAYDEGISVQNEFNVQNTTVQAQLDKAKKSLLEMRIELGEKLQPVAARTINVTSSFLRLLSTTISFVSRNKAELATLIATIVAYTIAVNASTIATKAHTAWITISTTVTKGYTAAMKALHAAHLLLQLGLAKLQGNWARQSWLMLDVKKVAGSLKTAYGLIAAAVVAVVGAVATAIVKYGEKQRQIAKLRKEQENYRNAVGATMEASKQAQAEYLKEKKRLDTLLATIRDNKKGLDERRAAIAKIQNIVPNYHASLNAEGKLTERNTNAIYDYLNALKRKAIAEALYQKLVESMSRRADAEMAAIAWDNGMRYRQQQIEKARQQARNDNAYTEEMTGGLMAGFSETAVVRRGTDAIGRAEIERQEKILEYDRQRRDFHRQRVKDEDAYQQSLRNYAKKMGAQAEYDDLFVSGGTTAGVTDPGFGGAPGTTGGGAGAGSGSGNGRGGRGSNADTTTDPNKEAMQKLEREALARRLFNELQYQTGVINEREYQEQILIIEAEMLEKQQALYAEGSDAWNALQEKRNANTRASLKQIDDWSLQDIARQETEEQRAVQDKYLHGQISEEEYQKELLRIRLEYLKRRKDYTFEVNSEDYAKYAVAYEDELYRQQVERQKKFLQQAQQMQQEYFKKSIDEREQEELALLAQLIAAGVIAKEKEEEYKAAIAKKYAEERAKQEKETSDKIQKAKEEADKKKGKISDPLSGSNSALDEWSNSFLVLMQNLNSLQQKLKDGEAGWQDYASVAVASLGMISAIASSFSNLFQAEQQGEEQAVTKRYDAEIEKVGQNSKRGKKLEEEKQKELAKIKNKYNSKAMAMEMAQAVANTAMAAINAYASAAKIPLIGWKIAPVAAALALAAGAVQIAAIKKQHAAQEASGYYSGGFTGGTRYRREAGIVHEGEFVANHEAVNNPQLLPVLQLIDTAQRNNTVARLTAEDVSRTLPGNPLSIVTSPISLAEKSTRAIATAVPTFSENNEKSGNVTVTTDPRTAEALERLTQRLEQPIETYVTIDGPNGLHRQYTKYQKMLGRK